MRLQRLCMFTLLALIGAAGPAPAQSDETLERLAEKYWDALMERFPTRATAIGDYRFNDRLDDAGEAGRKRWKATLQTLLWNVRKVPGRGLSADDRLTRDLLERSILDELLRIECHLEYIPLEPLYGSHLQLPLLLVSQPLRDVADFKAYAARLRAFSKQVTDIISNMRTGVRLKLVSPCVTIEKVIPQIRMHIVSDVTQSEFYALVRRATALSDADRKAVVGEITDAIASDVIPAYLQLLAFVEDEYLPLCRSTVGLGSLSGGDKVYEALVRLETTVRMPPEEIHALGLSEVARIGGEMAKVKEEVGFEGTPGEFLAHMRTDPRYRFTSGEELLAAADAILQRTRPLMPKLFGRLPKADCVMKEIEAFRAASSPVAYYNPPPEDGSRPGYYYINTYAPHERLRFTLEALTYHETIPGHHLQMTLDQENTALPKFRRYGRFTAYVEGWALYAEKLGYEIGGYRDPYARFGQLTFEMSRACRLVVDTGMHCKGWSRQQAIDYMAATTSLALLDIEAEIDRYIVWPGQALAYKIGELSILRLRKEAEEQLGEKFDLRAFHDALLSGGAMPIDVLEKRMRERM
ncbi:MAG: DUF885 domain-containing protein [Phycisphaerae bacterium]